MQNTQKIIFRDRPGLSVKSNLLEMGFNEREVTLMSHQRDFSLSDIVINLRDLYSILKLKLKLNIDTISQKLKSHLYSMVGSVGTIVPSAKIILKRA